MAVIDHVVYATFDLEAGVAEIEERLGVRARPGGRHPGAGTHNALLDLGGGTYLEIIAPDPEQPAPGRPRSFGLDELTAPRLAGWAARVSGLDERVTAARAAGHDPGAVTDMSRRLPGGELLAWRLTRSAGLDGDGLIPFLIDWGSSAHPSATAPPGARLLSLAAEHPDPEPIRTALAALEEAIPVHPGPAPALVATVRCPRGLVVLS